MFTAGILLILAMKPDHNHAISGYVCRLPFRFFVVLFQTQASSRSISHEFLKTQVPD